MPHSARAAPYACCAGLAGTRLVSRPVRSSRVQSRAAMHVSVRLGQTLLRSLFGFACLGPCPWVPPRSMSVALPGPAIPPACAPAEPYPSRRAPPVPTRHWQAAYSRGSSPWGAYEDSIGFFAGFLGWFAPSNIKVRI